MDKLEILTEAHNQLASCRKSLILHLKYKKQILELEFYEDKTFWLLWINDVIDTDQKQIRLFKELLEKWSK